MEAKTRILKPESDIEAFNIIRSETVLSKLPIHNLSKKGSINIQISKRNEHGELQLRWEVSPSRNYGEPRQLAYKLDTLIINRRIDEAGRPLPKIIRLGSLNDICRELGFADSGGNRNEIKKALRQNALAGITARLTYKSKDGTERRVDASDTRYGVIFTGEKLPDNSAADAIYITLHDFYWEVLNNAPVRPLNYDYLKELTPAAQRFYELVSFRVYAALKNHQPYAKFPYSDYCTFSAQTRYYTWEQVKKQMYKVHRPHIQSGYLARVHYEETVDAEGKIDWMMCYTCGPKAKGEHRAFTNKRQPQLLAAGKGEGSEEQAETPPLPATLSSALTREEEEAFKKLRAFGVAEPKATELVKTNLEAVKIQLAAWPHRNATPGNPAGMIIRAIETTYPLPDAYLEAEKKETARQARIKREADIKACPFCRDTDGFRLLAKGARRCTHNPEIEAHEKTER